MHPIKLLSAGSSRRPHPDDIVVLGGPPAPSHTRRARVAPSRLGFIVPTASAGGDALPLHDKASVARPDWKSPTGPRLQPPCSFDADTVVLGQLEPTEYARSATAPDSSPPTYRPDRAAVVVPSGVRRAARLLPWSLLLAVGGFWAVRMAALLAGQDGSVVAVVATVAVIVCGSLLVVAQVVDGLTK